MKPSERAAFVAALVERGWKLEAGATVCAPSEGLWFDEFHFENWTLSQFQDIFARRGQEIARRDPGNLHATENLEASQAAAELLSQRMKKHLG